MHFQTTRWTLVVMATSDAEEVARKALEDLCACYWPPLYAYVRSRGFSVEESKDLTQGFFTRVIEKRVLDHARPERGKFRSFLLASMKNFIANEWTREHTAKRGGTAPVFSLDGLGADNLAALEGGIQPPDRAYEVHWARTVLERAFTALKSEYADGRKQERFNLLRDYVTANPQRVPYKELAANLGMSIEALRIAVFRLRARYGELIRKEIAETLGPDDDLEEEIRYLLSVLAGQ